jgi:branched-chain amino acid transport system permease protein
MILLGGMHSFLGPLMGAFIFEILNDFVTANTRYYGLVLGLVILSFVLGLRRGLLDWLLIKFYRK